jgi:hypothetical protein
MNTATQNNEPKLLMFIVEDKIISSLSDPHYLICKGDSNLITKTTVLVTIKPFKDEGEANRYAKTLGKDHFAAFLNGINLRDIKLNKVNKAKIIQ